MLAVAQLVLYPTCLVITLKISMKIMYVFNQVSYNIPYAFIGMYFKCNSHEFSLKFDVQPARVTKP